MLAYGLKDPYTRFITPSEFDAMRKYDVTGVGLNLATAEEFSRKSGMSLPDDRKDADVSMPGPALYLMHVPVLGHGKDMLSKSCSRSFRSLRSLDQTRQKALRCFFITVYFAVISHNCLLAVLPYIGQAQYMLIPSCRHCCSY